MPTSSFIQACQQAIGQSFVLTQTQAMQPYLTDWRKRYTGHACAILRPGSTEEVTQLVQLAQQYAVALVPQGGNTGLVGGATPDESGQQAIISLQRLNQIRSIDLFNNTIIVEAGVILQHLQDYAQQHQRLFPLSLASQGSCTIGGNLSTNAGGTNVVRYGNTRDLCLGLEVVTATGEICHGLNSLRKNNTGYDLKNLWIGAEGTLGIITAAALKLFPLPIVQTTALTSMQTIHQAVQLLELTQMRFPNLLTGFELISNEALQLVSKHFPQFAIHFNTPTAYYVLIEFSEFDQTQQTRLSFETLLAQALKQHYIEDALIAENLKQSQLFWHLREHISPAQALEGLNIKHDIALPISAFAAFIDETNQKIQTIAPGAQFINFGHLGDGNLHYNIQAPAHLTAEDFLKHYHTPISQCVYQTVKQYHGSISAEHGIGQFKIQELAQYKSSTELHLMKQIKQAWDPHNLMNPGKIFAV